MRNVECNLFISEYTFKYISFPRMAYALKLVTVYPIKETWEFVPISA